MMRRGTQLGFAVTLAVLIANAVFVAITTRDLVEAQQAAVDAADLPAGRRAVLETCGDNARASARRLLLSFGVASALAVGVVLWEFNAFRNDVRRSEQSARELDDERERYRVTLASIDDGVIVTDPAGRVTFLNLIAEVLTGWGSDAIGRPLAEVFSTADVQDRSPLGTAETNLTARDGTVRPIEESTAPLRDRTGAVGGSVVVFRDVTEKKKLAEQLLRAQRMESIGTLAGGIAHDLNNVLTPVVMGLDILRGGTDESQRLMVLDTIQTAAKRGAELIKQVLLFSRGAERVRGVLPLKPLIKEVEQILGRTLPKSISVSVEAPPDLWPAPVDATQFTQVLMNLCVNARDAMSDGGELLLRAENLAADEHYARMHVDAKPGRYVAITVADTGQGIPPEVRDRMFDPFFTTKPPGQGTGLGLATALGIVRGHGGFINVYSEPGRGARFVVCFPAAKSSKEAMPAATGPQAAGHGELILVVDDEAAIAMITRHTLEAHGYKVMTANNGAEAVELFREHRGDVKAVLTDMMMPIMDGPATIRAIRQLDAKVPFIAASGLGEPSKAPDVAATLAKPFTAGALLTAVQSVLAHANVRNGYANGTASAVAAGAIG
jgi:PAS domain S-box-containing protein